jgi:hypothetical protein
MRFRLRSHLKPLSCGAAARASPVLLRLAAGTEISGSARRAHERRSHGHPPGGPDAGVRSWPRARRPGASVRWRAAHVKGGVAASASPAISVGRYLNPRVHRRPARSASQTRARARGVGIVCVRKSWSECRTPCCRVELGGEPPGECRAGVAARRSGVGQLRTPQAQHASGPETLESNYASIVVARKRRYITAPCASLRPGR